MDQLRFEWVGQTDVRALDETDITLDRETTEVAIALMARVLVVVVRGARETDDE
jgi:hypothetical protein